MKSLTLAALFALAAMACKSKGDASAGVPDAGTDISGRTPLERLASVVIPSCAVAGCHDAVSKTHAMDLSTPAKIRSAWVNQPGFDHCTGLNTPRVIPGDPVRSLVMMKIEGVAVCAQSQRMPLPPRAALTSTQIEVIRAWILAGAPGDDVPDAGTPSDAGDGNDASVDDAGAPRCTAETPCGPGLSCTGETCAGTWECMAHYEPTREHPCSEEIVQFCGCDGKTFEASDTCPDRPWLHFGACGDGVSCTAGMVVCSDPPPTCPPGQEPSVEGTCWGPCVPLDSCRCLYHWMCPNLAQNTCLLDTHRCGPNPNLADAGADAGAM